MKGCIINKTNNILMVSYYAPNYHSNETHRRAHAHHFARRMYAFEWAAFSLEFICIFAARIFNADTRWSKYLAKYSAARTRQGSRFFFIQNIPILLNALHHNISRAISKRKCIPLVRLHLQAYGTTHRASQAANAGFCHFDCSWERLNRIECCVFAGIQITRIL